MYGIAFVEMSKQIKEKMVDCCMHVGDFADDILPIETRHRWLAFYSVVDGCVANKLSEKIRN